MDSSLLRASIYNEAFSLEWTIHECPKTLWPTFREIFPDLSAILPKRSDPSYNDSTKNRLQIVTVFQPTTNDMSGFSDEVQDERDHKTARVRLLFIGFVPILI